jgi:stage IV sporulation protein A
MPNSVSCKELAVALEEKYNVPVLPLDVSNISSENITEIIKTILMEFPVTGINFKLPKWIMALPFKDEFIQKIMTAVKNSTHSVLKMSDYQNVLNMTNEIQEMKSVVVSKLNMSNGVIDFELEADDSLYYKMISKECGIDIKDDFDLMKHLKELTLAKKEYEKIKSALDMVKETGYGIVSPTAEDLVLEEPEIVTKNGNSTIKLKASASSLHIMRVDVSSEVCPAVGNVEQGGLLANYMMNEIENNKQEIWNKNMFGKPMNEIVKDSIDAKLMGLPEEVQVKMRKTLSKIVNERKGGVICILL